MRPVTLEDVRGDHEVQVFVRKADENLGVLGYTEHGPRHCSLVADVAEDVLLQLGYPSGRRSSPPSPGTCTTSATHQPRWTTASVRRCSPGTSCERLGMGPGRVAEVMMAIGNHEEEYGQAVSPLGRRRDPRGQERRAPQPGAGPRPGDVRHPRPRQHGDQRSFLKVDPEEHTITLELEIDTDIIQVMEYFEIFLDRMVMCRRAAEFLGCRFGIVINGTRLL